MCANRHSSLLASTGAQSFEGGPVVATHRRLRSALIPAQLAALVVGSAACGGSSGSSGGAATPAWNDTAVTAVSRPVTGSGVTAVTALRPDGHLQSVVNDVRDGMRLWARPAVISGRPGRRRPG